MGVEDESLARLWRGSLSLKDFEWQEGLRPDVPFDRFHEAGVIAEIDLGPLLQCCSDGGPGRAPPEEEEEDDDDDDSSIVVIRDRGEEAQDSKGELDQKLQSEGYSDNKEEMIKQAPQKQQDYDKKQLEVAAHAQCYDSNQAAQRQPDYDKKQLDYDMQQPEYDREQPDYDIRRRAQPGLLNDEKQAQEVQVRVVKELVCGAARRCGFFQVYNHGIPLAALRTLLGCSRRFFGLPFPVKARLARSLIGFLGSRPTYTAGNPGHSPNRWWCEALRLDSNSPLTIDAIAHCLWPENPHDQQKFRDALSICSHGLTKLAENLTRVLLEGLGIDHVEKVLKMCGDGKSLVKLGHYPSCPQPELTLGLPAHTDVTILSILFQDDVGGLQVQQDGSWASIRPRDDALVVNIGDIFQVGNLTYS